MMARARILATTEDAGKQAKPTIERIIKEALKLVVKGVDLNPKRIQIDFLADNDRAHLALRGNQWKKEPPTVDTIRLEDAIAGRLRERAGFVIFHFDTDEVWGNRSASDNRKKFETGLRVRVRRRLQGEGAQPINPRPRIPLTAEEIEDAMSRLLVLSPCYSIESWLYQATEELRDLCQNWHGSSTHARLIEAWAIDRARLDEVHRPKDDVLACVADHHNETLSKSFPAEDVWLADRSFHESVERLRACTALVEALSHSAS
jgi:hypothetical protein